MTQGTRAALISARLWSPDGGVDTQHMPKVSPLNRYKYGFSWRPFSFLFWFLHLKLPTPTSKVLNFCCRSFLGKGFQNTKYQSIWSDPLLQSLPPKVPRSLEVPEVEFQPRHGKIVVISSFAASEKSPTLRGPTFCANQSPTGGNQSWMAEAFFQVSTKLHKFHPFTNHHIFSFHDNHPRCQYLDVSASQKIGGRSGDISITQLAGKIPLDHWRWLDWSERWRRESNPSEFDPPINGLPFRHWYQPSPGTDHGR